MRTPKKMGKFTMPTAKVYTPPRVRLNEAASDMLDALKTLVADGECYCADNVANKEPCGHCRAVAAIAKAEEGGNGP